MTNDYDLSPEQAAALCKLTDNPRDLITLVIDRPPFFSRILRACDYERFRQAGWITDGKTVALTPLGVQAQTALKARKPRFTQERFEAGDLVTIIFITPIVGRNSRVLHWDAKTDSEYRLTLYPEDFITLKDAGYFVPAFDSRVAQGVQWDVYVSREPDKVTGWRVAGVARAG